MTSDPTPAAPPPAGLTRIGGRLLTEILWPGFDDVGTFSFGLFLAPEDFPEARHLQVEQLRGVWARTRTQAVAETQPQSGEDDPRGGWTHPEQLAYVQALVAIGFEPLSWLQLSSAPMITPGQIISPVSAITTAAAPVSDVDDRLTEAADAAMTLAPEGQIPLEIRAEEEDGDLILTLTPGPGGASLTIRALITALEQDPFFAPEALITRRDYRGADGRELTAADLDQPWPEGEWFGHEHIGRICWRRA